MKRCDCCEYVGPWDHFEDCGSGKGAIWSFCETCLEGLDFFIAPNEKEVDEAKRMKLPKNPNLIIVRNF